MPWVLKVWRGRSRVGSQETCYRAALLSSPHPIPQASAGGLQQALLIPPSDNPRPELAAHPHPTPSRRSPGGVRGQNPTPTL